MDDRYMGGLLTFILVAPVVVVCCSGGGFVLAAILSAIGGWSSGLGGIAMGLAAIGGVLLIREFRRQRPKSADVRQQQSPRQSAHPIGER